MEFIKKMKKREFIEMGLKTLAALLAAFVTIILMEGMIYGIQLNAYTTKGSTASYVAGQFDAYCIEKGDDSYVVLYHNVGDAISGENTEWFCVSTSRFTKQQCENLKTEARNVYYSAPNAFEFSIKPVHFVVMVIFIGLVSSYFVYRFVKLSSEYKKIETKFKETGTIEISNL